MVLSVQRRVLLVVGLVAVLEGAWAEHVRALPRYGPIDISGNVSSQQLIRMTSPTVYAFVQQRNTIKLRLDYQIFEYGKLAERFEIPFISSAKLFLLYRGVYDSVYSYQPGFTQKDIWGNPAAIRFKGQTQATIQRLSSLGPNPAPTFDSDLREAYLDIRFKGIPLSVRAGRQQVVWGETDNFRLLDRTNSLDLTWHLQQESWDELRIPDWIIKGLYQLPDTAGFSNMFVEAYWDLGDWVPGRKAFLPRPWSSPVVNPITLLAQVLNTDTLYHKTRLFKQGNYHRNPIENSQVGIRFNAVTPQGVQFTLNYFYGRWAGDDGTNSAPFRGVLSASNANEAYFVNNQLPIEAIQPYVNAIGTSLNYADEDYTEAVFRMEMIGEFGVPFTDASKQFQPGVNPLLRQVLGHDVYGVSKRSMWKGMLGFDRPTWIRFLNRKSTFLVLGQFFWHYLANNPTVACNNPNEAPPCPASGQGHGFRGQFSTSGFQSGGEAFGHGTPFFDRVGTWESLFTLATTTFYSGGKIVPLVAYILDPVNSYNQEVLGTVDYFITNDLIFNVAQRYFINTTSKPVFETWGVAGINRGRSETQLKLTYQF